MASVISVEQEAESTAGVWRGGRVEERWGQRRWRKGWNGLWAEQETELIRETEELPKSVKGKVEAGNLAVLEVTGIQSVLQQDHSVMKYFTQKTKFLKILTNKILCLYWVQQNENQKKINFKETIVKK